ncbi:MAG: PQQ-binding-like beta-propeller repeat protein, partial [Planctomycetota bacterium]
GYHQADASGLEHEKGKISGTLKVYINSDGWFPWRGSGRPPLELTFQLDGKLKHHQLSGTFTASGDMGEYTGTVRGTGGPGMQGRYTSSGQLPDGAGQVYGMVLNDFPPIAEQLTTLPEDKLPEGAALGELANQLMLEIRALSLCLQHPHLPLAAAVNQCHSAQVAWGNGHVPADWARLAADWMTAGIDASPPQPRPIGADSPAMGTRAMDLQDDSMTVLARDLDPAVWYTVPAWRAIGPFGQRPGLEHNSARAPEIVPIFDQPMHQVYDRLAAKIDNPEQLKWREVRTSSDRIADPMAKAGFFARFQGEIWYAAAEIESDTARKVTLAIDSADHAKCWVNGQLVWTGREKVYRYHSTGRQLVEAELAAGRNTILLRVHRDRKPAWVRLAVKAGAVSPEPAGPADTQAAASVFGADAPPIAWDIEKGINVAWRRQDLGGASRPVVHKGRILVTQRPGRLLAIDPADGSVVFDKLVDPISHLDAEAGQRWDQADAGEKWQMLQRFDKSLNLRLRGLGNMHVSAPAVGDRRIYVHVETGVLRAFDESGDPLWLSRTDLKKAVVHPVGRYVVTEGEINDAWSLPGSLAWLRKDKKRHPAVGVVILDAQSGKIISRMTFPGEFSAGSSHVLSAGDQASAALLTSTGMLVDLGQTPQLRGPLLAELPGPTQETFQAGGQTIGPRSGLPYDFAIAGGRLFMTTQEQSVALSLGASDGRLWYGSAWQSNYEHTGFTSFIAPSVANEEYLFTINPVLERGPHCPDARLELHVQDAATGRPLGRLKPALSNAVQHRVSPVIAGKYIYCTDSGGGSHGGLPDAGQIVVATADERLIPLARNRVDLGQHLAPVFIGNRMLLRSGRALTCIAVTDQAGRTWQAEVMAESVLADLGAKPILGDPARQKPLDLSTVSLDRPVGPLVPGVGTDNYLTAGPFKSISDKDIQSLPAMRIGAKLDIAGRTDTARPVPREYAHFTAPQYVAQYMLQGTGEIVPVFNTRLDPRISSGPQAGSGLFVTLLDNRRDRYVVPAPLGKGVRQWLNDKPIQRGQPIHLPPGLFRHVVVVDPSHYQHEQQDILPPINVANALADKAISPVDVSTWSVIGPLPGDAAPLKPAQLKTFPESVDIGGQTFPAYSIQPGGQTLLLTCLIGLADGQKPDHANAPETVKIASPMLAYAALEFEAPADGYLYLTTGADWFFQWILDGQVVYDRMKEGNGAAPTDVKANPMALQVSKGKHVLVAAVKPGSRGWSITTLAGFSTKTPEQLKAYRVASRIQPTEPDPKIQPSFVEIPHPPTRLARWQEHLQQRRALLEQIRDDLGEAETRSSLERLLKE